MEKKPFHQWYLENKLTHGFEERGNFAGVMVNVDVATGFVFRVYAYRDVNATVVPERHRWTPVKTNSLFIEPPNEKKSYKHYQRGKNRGFDLDALWQEYEEYLKGEVIL